VSKATLVMMEWDDEGNLAALHSSTGRIYRPRDFDDLRRIFTVLRDEPGQKDIRRIPNWQSHFESLVSYCASHAAPAPLRPIVEDCLEFVRPRLEDALVDICGLERPSSRPSSSITVVQETAGDAQSSGVASRALPGRVRSSEKKNSEARPFRSDIPRVNASRRVRRRNEDSQPTEMPRRRIRRKSASS